MKLSEFIEELEELKKEHGDKEIVLYVPEDDCGYFYPTEPYTEFSEEKDSFVM